MPSDPFSFLSHSKYGESFCNGKRKAGFYWAGFTALSFKNFLFPLFFLGKVVI